MKKVKSSITKQILNIEKKYLITFTVLILIIFGLIVYICCDKNGNTNTTKLSQLRINNDLGDSTACKSSNITSDTSNIQIKFCGNGKVVILDSTNIATETEQTTTENETSENNDVTDTSKCTSGINEKSFNVDDVVDLYSSFDYANNYYVYYILTEDGKVYTTNDQNIVSKNYDVNAIDDLKNIVAIDDYITYENNTNIYTNDVYAIDQEGKLHFLRKIY